MPDVVIAVTEVFGGLALFLYGLGQLSDGLKTLAGDKLRSGLQKAVRRRVGGYTLGTALGFLMHSSGATVMLVGFLNAGLIGLTGAVPVVLGANLGTTLSMQAISFNITALSYPVLALGMALTFLRGEYTRATGRALFGFGLLFLGMHIMSDGVAPYRESLRPLLQNLNGDTWTGMAGGILLSLLLTAVLQSSGATIGMSFALVEAGVFTSLSQILPVILGAHIGTCVTAALAGLGSAPSARRVAVAHGLFNLFNVTLAVIFHEPLLRLMSATADDLTRQAANLHTGVMLIASLALLPVAGLFTRVVNAVSPSAWRKAPHSYLTPDSMARIDTAIPAVRNELVRLAHLGLESLHLSKQLLVRADRDQSRRVASIEEVFDAVKLTMIRHLRELGHRPEASRDAIMELDHWIHCVVQMERVGDHLQSLGDISRERRNEPGHVLFGKELTHRLDNLFEATGDLLNDLVHSLSEHNEANAPLNARRKTILDKTEEARALLGRHMARARLQPRALYYYSSYLEIFERLSRHIELVATQSPVTYLEQTGYEEVAADAPTR